MAEPHHRCKTITTELPHDILFYNILPRLPAKDLLRCKVVSRQWHSSLKTPTFTHLHYHHLINDDTHQNHHKLLVFSTTTPFVFHTIDCEAPEDGLTAGRPLPFDDEPPDMRVLTSCRGLVCIESQYSDLMILWNPLTGEYKKLSKPKSQEEFLKREENLFGLYYSSCDDDYKLLCVTLDCDVYIYSLKSDVWQNKIDSTEQLKRINYGVTKYWSSCTQVNEKLYFLNRINFLENEPLDRLTHSVIRFDPNTEKFTVIATPVPGNRYVKCLNHQGCLHLYVAYFKSMESTLKMIVELWRLDGDDGDWTKVVTYQLPDYASWSATHPVHLMRDGKWLTTDINLVSKFDLARSIKDTSWSYIKGSMHIPTKVKYIETLVSPNRYL